MTEKIIGTTVDSATARSAGTPAERRPGGVRLEVRGLSKRYGQRTVLHSAQLSIEPGQFVAIVGRSGCGKSTLLRLVAGLESASAGQIEVDGVPLTGLSDDTRIMFQDARLLPWKRVAGNVALGLPAAQRAAASDVLVRVGLGERQGDWPARLSGGQRQRVALARALVHNPRLLLLDEPLGALDALTRIEMHRLIEDLWRASGFTALLVTHDVQEAVALADRVVLIEDGRIALDETIALARPRSHGDPAFALLEKRILDRVLQKPGSDAPAAAIHRADDVPDLAAHRAPRDAVLDGDGDGVTARRDGDRLDGPVEPGRVLRRGVVRHVDTVLGVTHRGCPIGGDEQLHAVARGRVQIPLDRSLHHATAAGSKCSVERIGEDSPFDDSLVDGTATLDERRVLLRGPDHRQQWRAHESNTRQCDGEIKQA